jgi:quinol monooxygenase YgiN
MKTKNIVLKILLLFIFSFVSCNKKIEPMTAENNQKNLIVLVEYNIQPTKSDDAIAGLTELIENVTKEPHFVSIKLHSDLKDESKILLYEEWSNETYYNTEHMKTEHLRKFIEDSRTFLAGPPNISQWKIEKEFNPE